MIRRVRYHEHPCAGHTASARGAGRRCAVRPIAAARAALTAAESRSQRRHGGQIGKVPGGEDKRRGRTSETRECGLQRCVESRSAADQPRPGGTRSPHAGRQYGALNEPPVPAEAEIVIGGEVEQAVVVRAPGMQGPLQASGTACGCGVAEPHDRAAPIAVTAAASRGEILGHVRILPAWEAAPRWRGTVLRCIRRCRPPRSLLTCPH